MLGLAPSDTQDGPGPAPEAVTNAIYARTKALTSYRLVPMPAGGIDLHTLGERSVGALTVEVVDPVSAYVDLMRELFDLDGLRAFVRGHPQFKFLLDGMSGGAASWRVRAVACPWRMLMPSDTACAQ
jgi:phosphoglucomutase